MIFDAKAQKKKQTFAAKNRNHLLCSKSKNVMSKCCNNQLSNCDYFDVIVAHANMWQSVLWAYNFVLTFN